MYCLECGNKVESGDEKCSKCGMTVAEMRERIDRAVEMVTYTDAVGPNETTKLPPVREREYVSNDGSTIDPSKPVKIDASKSEHLSTLPTIGADGDPYLTMPIQRIVDDQAKVLFDADTTPKVYSQPEPKKFNPIPLLVTIIVLLLMTIGVLGYLLASK